MFYFTRDRCFSWELVMLRSLYVTLSPRQKQVYISRRRWRLWVRFEDLEREIVGETTGP